MTREVRIQAPQDQVWEQVADWESYPSWNPFFTSIEGNLKVGEKVHVTMVPVGKKPQKFSPKVLSVDPGKGWVWRGRVGMPGLFDGRHTFTIERVDAKTVVFRQQEHFSGILVPFLGYRPYAAGWERMNEALQERAQKAAPKQ